MAPPVRLEEGTIIGGDFRVVRPLAEGGMGALYQAAQLSTRKMRALKVLRPALLADAAAREAFVREATVGATIRSDHVVEVIAAGIEPGDGLPWLAMELLEGRNLWDLLEARGPMGLAEAREVFEQLCHGLGAAHAQGVVHRDLKPQNVFVARARRPGVAFTVKLLDFGIARLAHAAEALDMVSAGAQADTTAPAQASRIMGSPLWMAPEQVQLGPLSPRTDVWALGLMVFWALTGRVYWRAGNGPSPAVEAVLSEKLFAPLEAPSVRAAQLDARPDALPPGFDDWFARCVARDARQRFADATEAWSQLAPLLGTATAPRVVSNYPPAMPQAPAPWPGEPWGLTPVGLTPPAGATPAGATPQGAAYGPAAAWQTPAGVTPAGLTPAAPPPAPLNAPTPGTPGASPPGVNPSALRRGLRAHWPWLLLAGAVLFAGALVTIAWNASDTPADDPSVLRIPPGGHRVGETFTLAGFEYRVASARASRRIAGGAVNEQAAPGTHFVVVRYTETNRGSSTHIGVGDNCTLRDANGRVYHASARAEAAATAALGVQAPMVVELHANVPREALAAFEVATDSLLRPVDIDFEERGFFNTGHTSVRALVPPTPSWAEPPPPAPPSPSAPAAPR